MLVHRGLIRVTYLCLLAVFSIGCQSGPSHGSHDVLYRLNWGEIYSGQSEKDFLEITNPQSIHKDGLFTSYLFLDDGHQYLEVMVYKKEIVSAMSMSDTGPIMIYFDSNPETLEKRLLLAKVHYWELKSKWDEVSGVQPHEDLDVE